MASIMRSMRAVSSGLHGALGRAAIPGATAATAAAAAEPV